MLARRITCSGFVLAASLLAACSEQSASPPAPTTATPVQQPAANAQAAKIVEMYRQLLLSGSFELAGPIGQEIVAKYPGSPEAKEVQETLTDTLAKAQAITTRRRLERL